METSEKVEENRLRRVAARRGYELHKSRRRDPKASDYGKYVLHPSGTQDTWDANFWLTFDEVCKRLEVIRQDEECFEFWATIHNTIQQADTEEALRWIRRTLEEGIQKVDRKAHAAPA